MWLVKAEMRMFFYANELYLSAYRIAVGLTYRRLVKCAKSNQTNELYIENCV